MSTLKVDTIKSDTTPTLTISDGLSVAGVSTFSNAAVISEDNAIHFRGTSADDSDAILRQSAGGGQLLINSRNDAIVNIDSNADSSDAHFAIGHGAATGSSTELFRVQEDGKIGIGTDDPGGPRLEVYNTDSAFNILSIRSGAGAYGQAGIAFGSNVTKNRQKATIFFQERTGGAHHAGDLVISIDGASGDAGTAGLAEERVRFQASGHVGIGTSMPTDRPASSNTRILNVGIVTANSVYGGAFIPTEGQISNRNVIINGAMAIAQRGTSSTSSGYKHIDRWAMTAEGANTTLTQSQVDVSSGTTPYQLGFRKAFKILNAGQSNSNVGGDTLRIEQHIEDQIIAQSGWNYKSSSSYLTLSFWVKSSVAQDFVILLQTRSDLGASGAYTYSQEFTVGSTNTWTKITTKIPGASSLTLDNDNSRGLSVAFYMYMGGDDTSNSHTDGAWQAYNNSDLAKQQDITWWTTSNATIEYTGVQVEVGEYATPFEHLGYDKELARCQRYCQVTDDGGCGVGIVGGSASGNRIQAQLRTTMRAAPTVTKVGNNIYVYDGSVACQVSGTSAEYGNPDSFEWEFDSLAAGDPLTAGRPLIAYINGSSGGFKLEAEL